MDRKARLALNLRYQTIFDMVMGKLEEKHLADSKVGAAIFRAYTEYGDCAMPLSVLKETLSESLSVREVKRVAIEFNGMQDNLSERSFEIIASRFEKVITDSMFEETIKKIIDSGRSNEDLSKMAQIAEFTLKPDRIINFSRRATAEAVMQQHEERSLVPSSFSCINATLNANAYVKGQIVLVAAAPGVGKSTFMITEGCHALKQGEKVFSVYLGDLSEYDVLSRWTSCLTGTSLVKVAVDIGKYRDQARGFFRNHRAICFPAYELDAQKLKYVCKRAKQRFNFGVLIIDYDSNIAPTIDSMYQEGGATYAIIDQIAKELNCLVFIGCQTKNMHWGDEIVPLAAAAESSRKQHTVDVMLGLGKNQDVHTVGTINMAKVRRGKPDVKFRVKLDMGHSAIKEITKEEYDRALMDGAEKKSRTREGAEGTTNGPQNRRKRKFGGGR